MQEALYQENLQPPETLSFQALISINDANILNSILYLLKKIYNSTGWHQY